MFKIFGLSAFFVLCFAETPSGQYPPSGWRPIGAPFTLPQQYLPSQQQQQQQQAQQVEITKERVEYVGQTVESTSTNAPISTTYAPSVEIPEEAEEEEFTEQSATDDYLKVQGLPTTNNFPNFQNPNQQQPNGQFRLRTLQQERSQNGQLNQQEQFLQTQQQKALINTQKVQQQFNFVGRQPLTNYGPPQPSDAEENIPAVSSTVDETENIEEQQDVEENPISGNAQNPINSNGQYYILTPDNTLQRVIFMTSQNEEEARTNGFTAQLRYMPVEPIRDPIYSYNEKGQLVRIFKK